MPEYHVSRSVTIDKPVYEVVAFLSDFHNWPEWSPWLILDPACKLEYRGEAGEVDSEYHWDGELVGAGSMRTTEVETQRLEMALTFVRPFKSRARVVFEAEATADNGTEVVWHMYGHLPWFLFFLKKMMKSMISMDYQRGLRMLKSRLETGKVISSLSDKGLSDWPSTHFIGLAGGGTTEDIGLEMPKLVEQLKVHLAEHGILEAGPLFTYYRSMDMERQYFEYWVCYPLSAPVKEPAPFICGTLPKSTTYVVEHKGEYQFLGNAWSLAFMAARHNKIRVKRRPLGIELYVDDPEKVAPEALRTQVILLRK